MPRALLAVAAALVLLALAAAPALAAPCPGADRAPSAQGAGQARAATLCLVNAERRRHGLRRLRLHGELQRASQRYARDMVARRFFSHVSPGGARLTARIRAAGAYLDRARGFRVGENLAWGPSGAATPREIVRSWLGSPGHRRNMLDRRFREVGLGIALGTPTGRGGATYANQFGVRG
jgi:uncharacterized protein YkwD